MALIYRNYPYYYIGDQFCFKKYKFTCLNPKEVLGGARHTGAGTQKITLIGNVLKRDRNWGEEGSSM